jgi:colanic acid biosynthesis glycosyl transferase WcaI
VNRKKKLLIINQVYLPDPAAVGQYVADVAEEMAKRNWDVMVLTANRGYDEPHIKYPRTEVLHGVSIHRLPLSSFGKRSILIRSLAGFIFIIQCSFIGLLQRNIDRILVSTSPPFSPLAAVFIKIVRKAPIIYWIMDINPDQMIQLGQISEGSIVTRLLNRLNQIILKSADNIITLDELMAKRIKITKDVSKKISVITPWPLQSYIEEIPHAENHFRKKHGLDDKIVFMYSGNHSITNPLDTLLQAALELPDYPDIIFMFIGGGVKKQVVDVFIQNEKPSNIISLPYQPLNTIKYSLSAADIHVVSIGNEVVGVVHPSKIYGAMAVGRPILYLGPDKSYISDVINKYKIGWHVNHGDVDRMIDTIKMIASLPSDQLDAIGKRSKELANTVYSKDTLMNRLCDIIEDKRR